jgi:hypothetical protein
MPHRCSKAEMIERLKLSVIHGIDGFLLNEEGGEMTILYFAFNKIHYALDGGLRTKTAPLGRLLDYQAIVGGLEPSLAAAIPGDEGPICLMMQIFQVEEVKAREYLHLYRWWTPEAMKYLWSCGYHRHQQMSHLVHQQLQLSLLDLLWSVLMTPDVEDSFEFIVIDDLDSDLQQQQEQREQKEEEDRMRGTLCRPLLTKNAWMEWRNQLSRSLQATMGPEEWGREWFCPIVRHFLFESVTKAPKTMQTGIIPPRYLLAHCLMRATLYDHSEWFPRIKEVRSSIANFYGIIPTQIIHQMQKK